MRFRSPGPSREEGTQGTTETSETGEYQDRRSLGLEVPGVPAVPDVPHVLASPGAYRRAALTRALAASTSRLRGEPLVTSEASSVWAALEICATAVSKASSFALEGLVKPLIFRTNWREALRISP